MATGISIKGIVAPNGDVHHFDHEYLDNNPNIPAIDTGLDTVGAAADSAAVGGAVGALNEGLNELTGLVDYNYDTPYHSEPNPSHAYSSVGITRNRTEIVLNGTATGGSLRVRISGTVSSVASSASVDAWTGIDFTEGHRYAVKCKHISGEATGIYISVYKEGEHNSVGEYTDDGTTFVRTFTADGSKYNIALYLAEDNTYIDATYIVTLTDLDISQIGEINGDITDLTNKVAIIRDEIDTSYDTEDISGLFEQGGYNRSGTRLSSQSYVAANIVTTNFLPDNLIRFTVGGTYKISLIAFNSSGAWVGFLVDDYEFTNVSTDTWYFTQDILLSKYRKLFPTYSFRMQMLNSAGQQTPVYPSEASYIATYAEATGGIKDYYKAEMEATLASVRESLTEPALVFPLVTDIHYQSKNAFFDDCADNMREFASKVRCDFILNLGDDTDGNTAQATTLARAYHMRERFAEIDLPYYHAAGNHDTNYYQSAPLFNSDQIFSAYLSNTRGVHYNMTLGEKDFYRDFDELGIRLIVLDGNKDKQYQFSANTATWLTNTALDTDYIVVIGVHFSPIKEQNWASKSMTNAPAVAAAIQAFVDGSGTVIQFCGHSHVDYSFSTPWLSIHNNCQKFEQSDLTESGFAHLIEATDDIDAPERTEGTATEDCWSVVIIKPISRKVDVIRFGAGDDREFDF